MTQKEFNELSARKVTELNNGDEKCRESWRDGYITAMYEVQKVLEEERNTEIIEDRVSKLSDIFGLSAFDDGD